MPTLTIEPRDAGTLDPEDLTIEFEDELDGGTYGMERCFITFKRGVSTSRECYETVP
jgi:hypothetical protein